MNEIYYYIDEAGGIDNDSKYFIVGCYRTDTPEQIRVSLEKLRDEIMNSPIFAYERRKFAKQGFHATKNHFDIRSRMYNHIVTLNVRGYILLVDKSSEFFLRLKSEGLSLVQIYMHCIEKLMRDRLVKNRHEKNVLVFEQFGNKPQKWLKSVEDVMINIKNHVKKSFGADLNYRVEIKDKSDLNLSIIDYLSYIFYHCFEEEKPDQRMIENFRIVEPKIGLIYKMDKDIFYDKNNRIDIKSY